MSQQLHTAFLNPSAAYRPAPLWVWNDDMEKGRLREQLMALKSHGFGGAFVHPRPGLITEYLSEDWFELWSEALSIAIELELKLYMYDENSYPSGFAGGHIPSQLPDCLANAVTMKQWNQANWREVRNETNTFLNKPGHPIRAYAYETSADGQILLMKDVTVEPLVNWDSYGEQFVVFELGTPETNSWLGGFAYTDILRPEVTELFLQTTYEVYYERYGAHFGGAIPAIFTDEPEISPGNLFQSGANFLPFSYWFAAEFLKRNGYSLMDCIPALFMDVQGGLPVKWDAQKIRYDYYDTLRELWVNNSVKPISTWCQSHGIAYTGHYLEHSWPYPWGRSSPSVMSLYEYMDWPAIDMLMTHLLKKDVPESHLMVTIREAHSAANQMAHERVLCEAYGAGGWDSTFEDYRRIGDWLYVHGINFMNQHLTFSTIAGARKRDHPQSFDWRQPWWEEYSDLNDYFARLSVVLSQGETHNRLLVLNPTTSAYLRTPDQGTPGLVSDHQGELATDLALFQFLCDQQWDYDFGDEFIIQNHGDIEDGHFRVGARSYEVVIIPCSMIQLKETTRKLLLRYMNHGGRVLILNDRLSRVDGIPADEQITELRSHTGWIGVHDFASMDAELRKTLEPRLEWASSESDPIPGIAHLRRVYTDESSFYFITNSSSRTQEGTLKIEGSYAEVYDAWDGSSKPVDFEKEGERLIVRLSLPASGSILLRVDHQHVPRDSTADDKCGHEDSEQQLSTLNWHSIAIDSVTVKAENSNIMPIDYCTLDVDGMTYREISTIYAADKLFEHRGFAGNPWDNGIQFKNRLLSRNRFYGPSSGFTVAYSFHVANDAAIDRTYLGIEHANWYQVFVNNTLVEGLWTASAMDHAIVEMDITSHLLAGENVIQLRASTFHIRMEIEPVYLRGEFGMYAQQGRWTIGKKPAMTKGSWLEQGYPFYSGAVLYTYTFAIIVPSQEICLSFPQWEATVISVFVDGTRIGLVGTDGNSSLELPCHLTPGVHELKVRVCGSFKNVLGPHHDPERPRNAAWPGCWKQAPKQGQPAAENYDFIAYGLFGDVGIQCR